MLPNVTRHSKPVAFDMSLAYLTLEIIQKDSYSQIEVPREALSMGLKDLLQYIQKRRQTDVEKLSDLFNDNTINIACIVATQELAETGDSVTKREDSQYVSK